MSSINPQSFIEGLFQQNSQNGKKDAIIAGQLNSLISTGFTNSGCFINELLQNANDQLDPDSEVHFDLQEDELIFYHHGKTFDQQDVEGICSFGDIENNRKNQSKDKTGCEYFLS